MYLGPSIPRKNDVANRTKYCKIMNLLFNPFRNLKDLFNVNWNLKYNRFINSHPPKEIINYIENAEYLKKALSDATDSKMLLDDKDNNIQIINETNEETNDYLIENDNNESIEIVNELDDFANLVSANKNMLIKLHQNKELDLWFQTGLTIIEMFNHNILSNKLHIKNTETLSPIIWHNKSTFSVTTMKNWTKKIQQSPVTIINPLNMSDLKSVFESWKTRI